MPIKHAEEGLRRVSFGRGAERVADTPAVLVDLGRRLALPDAGLDPCGPVRGTGAGDR